MSNITAIGRRWLQFSLRRLLFFTLLAGGVFGYVGYRVHQARLRAEAKKDFEKLGGLLFWEEDNPRLAVAVSALSASEFDGEYLEQAARALRRLPAVSLSFGFAAFQNEDVARLAEMDNLVCLDLCRSQVDDDVVDILAAMPSLELVDLSWTRMTPSGRDRLKRLRPDLIVLADLPGRPESFVSLRNRDLLIWIERRHTLWSKSIASGVENFTHDGERVYALADHQLMAWNREGDQLWRIPTSFPPSHTQLDTMHGMLICARVTRQLVPVVPSEQQPYVVALDGNSGDEVFSLKLPAASVPCEIRVAQKHLLLRTADEQGTRRSLLVDGRGNVVVRANDRILDWQPHGNGVLVLTDRRFFKVVPKGRSGAVWSVPFKAGTGIENGKIVTHPEGDCIAFCYYTGSSTIDLKRVDPEHGSIVWSTCTPSLQLAGNTLSNALVRIVPNSRIWLHNGNVVVREPGTGVKVYEFSGSTGNLLRQWRY